MRVLAILTLMALLLSTVEAFAPLASGRNLLKGSLTRHFSETTSSASTETSSSSSSGDQVMNKKAAVEDAKAKGINTDIWPGDRPPMMNENLKLQRMSATWGRGRFRTEVWDDDVNPVNNWWEAYAPSAEQLEAFKAGYDFNDPKGYFESKGIEYEAARDETKSLLEAKVEKLKKELEEVDAKFTEEEFQKLVDDMFKMQTLAYERAFRIVDDRKQAAKGQPSLDDDDTGDQWANDP